MKRCIAVAFPDCLYIQKKSGYINSINGEPRHLYQNSSLAKNRHPFLVGIPMNFQDLCNKDIYRRIIAPTEFSLDEVIECFSDELEVTYALEHNDIFNAISSNNVIIHKVLLYNGIEIKRLNVGTVAELRVSDPEGFYKKEEIDTKFNQKYLATYYHDLKVASRLILK